MSDAPTPRRRGKKVPVKNLASLIGISASHLNERLPSDPDASAREEASELVAEEAASYEHARDTELIASLRITNEHSQQDLSMRRQYAQYAYWLAVGSVAFWMIMFFWTGVLSALLGRQVLSDAALVALTTGATVNVIAAFVGVIRGLFPQSTRNAVVADRRRVTKRASSA